MAATAAARVSPRSRLAAVLFAALVAVSLVGGLVGGLFRAGVPLSVTPGALASHATLFHAALMLGGFLGTVIGIERAVALKHRAAFGAPLASGIAGVLLLAGQAAAAAVALVIAAVVFVAVNAAIVRRQNAAHTVLLLVAAVAWLAGNVLFAATDATQAAIIAWFLFIAATIAAERLELTRLAPRPAHAPRLLFAILGLAAAAAALAVFDETAGGVLFGATLVALALWFALYDIARRTIFTRGLSRYMAACLLGGYAWLAIAGVAWSATALGLPARDAALHALGLGFILSMVMGHAPVILPAVTGLRLDFTPALYVPLGLLHASLALRLAADGTRAVGAALNAVALVLFAVTMAVLVLRKRFARPIVAR
jgi:hypothetical protein